MNGHVCFRAVGAWRGLLGGVCLAAAVFGQTPQGTVFTYQGRLKDGGNPASGAFDLRFRLYNALAGGSQVGSTQCLNDVPVADGLFTTQLDFGAQFSGEARYVEIDVRADVGTDCANASGFTTLSPRQMLTAAPAALNADKLDGLDSSAFLQAVPNPLTLTGSSATHIIRGENSSNSGQTSGVVGASTGSGGGLGVLGQQRGGAGFFPSAGAGVFGTSNSGVGAAGFSNTGDGMYAVSFAASGATHGLSAESRSTSGIGLRGTATAASGTTYGGYFQSASPSGCGAFGHATAASGRTYGVLGRTDSTDGYGVYGQCTSSSGSTYGVYGQSAATGGVGAFGSATATAGTTSGLWGQSESTGGRGVYGLASAATGTTCGVYGRSASVDGRGVFGYAQAAGGATHGGYFQSQSTDGIGVGGYSTAASGITYGVYGSSASPFGFGVFGTSVDNAGVVGYATGISGTNYGGDFETLSMTGYGVFGVAKAASGTNYGGYFESRSTEGIGVRGEATATTGTTYGGRFGSNSTTGRAVYGYAGAGGASDIPYGVRGYCSTATNGHAVYASGDMGASGNKSFRIDHPFDPQNKYLLHYCAEGPEPQNVYNGVVALDGSGEAEITLPDYFAAINRDPRYTLTAVGAPMPMLHVAEEISEEALEAGEQAGPADAPPTCWFRIAGGVAGAKVSWEVKAVRNDLRMRLHGAPVEREKTGPERGKYQHPEYYGEPPEMGMDYDAERERPSPPTSPDATRQE